MKELFISTDVETDGPIPGPHSMLSLGAAAFTDVVVPGDPRRTIKLVSQFEVNLELLEGAKGDPDTMKWWESQPEAWKACRENPKPPAKAMADYVTWVNEVATEHKARPVFVGYPASFDFMFTYWYIVYFGLESPFSFSALDMKTYAKATLKIGFRETTKKRMPKAWFRDLPPHTHRAVDDAIEQGQLFLNMLVANEDDA